MIRLIDEGRKVTYALVFGYPAMLVTWAICHDQYLVSIAPEHFTEYHEPLSNIENPRAIAALYALGATIGPGLLMGILLAYLGRHGSRPRMSLCRLFFGFGIVIAVTELAAATSGLAVWMLGRPFYPADWFPDETLPITVTQTIQLTAYFTATVASALFSMAVWNWRRRRENENQG